MAEAGAAGEIAVVVRYFAAAQAAAGTAEEQVALPATATVGDVLSTVIARHGPALDRVIGRCSFLLNEIAVHGAAARVRNGDAVDVLPPFAGG